MAEMWQYNGVEERNEVKHWYCIIRVKVWHWNINF